MSPDDCPPDLDQVTDADRDWFTAHRRETERWRPITQPEINQAARAGETFDRTWWVRVSKVPGGRVREFYPVIGFAGPGLHPN